MSNEGSGQGLDLWWQKFHILGTTLVGVAGIVLSGVLIWTNWADKEQEGNRQADELERAKESSATNDFKHFYQMARNAQPDDEYARTDLDLAGAIAQTLAQQYNKRFYLDAVVTLRTRYARQESAGEQQGAAVTLQTDEALSRPGIGTSADEWFAVIATYSGNSEGLELAKKRGAEAQRTLGCTEVWRTKIGGQYVVVFGGKMPRASALTNSQIAREKRVALDAFTQANREWTRWVTCQAMAPDILRPRLGATGLLPGSDRRMP